MATAIPEIARGVEVMSALREPAPALCGLTLAPKIYVTDRSGDRVQKFTSSGGFITKWGSFGSGDGQFNIPTRVATDGSGNVYVTDRDNSRVQKFTSSGTFLAKWGSSGSGDGQFDLRGGVATDGSGNVYVVDNANSRVQKFAGGS